MVGPTFYGIADASHAFAEIVVPKSIQLRQYNALDGKTNFVKRHLLSTT